MAFISRMLRNTSARRTRPRPGVGTSVLSASDFTYQGAYRIPRSPMTGVESFYGSGMTVRRESSDGTNPVHLLLAGYSGGTPNHEVYEIRDATPTQPGSPTVIANYGLATVVKQYGDVYSGKKRIIYGGVDTPLTVQLDGDLGLHWDETGSRLYWSYGFGYSSDNNSWCLGYSTLDYAAGTGAGFGPWGFTGQSWKAMQAGLVGVPSSYATAYLSGKRLAIGMGGYYSLIANCDCSLGPSLTAFDPGALPAAESYATGTPLVGYWPHATDPGAGKGRCNRPEDATGIGVGETWPVGKWTWNDRLRSGTWIDNGTKRGVVFVGHYGRGRTQYLSSQIPSSRQGHLWAIYDPDDFTPVSGTARYDVQPDSIFDVQYPTVDYSKVQYAGGPAKSVSSIVSSAGVSQASSTGCTVTCSSHGYIAGNYVEIHGSSLSEYNAIWEIPTGGVINANSFYISNTSTPPNWSGVSPSGTITAKQVSNTYDRPLGVSYDATGSKMYIAVAVEAGVNNSEGHVMIHVYSVGA